MSWQSEICAYLSSPKAAAFRATGPPLWHPPSSLPRSLPNHQTWLRRRAQKDNRFSRCAEAGRSPPPSQPAPNVRLTAPPPHTLHSRFPGLRSRGYELHTYIHTYIRGRAAGDDYDLRAGELSRRGRRRRRRRRRAFRAIRYHVHYR